MKKSLNVLIIAPYYHTFVKGLADATANYVSNITVLVRYNYLAELAPYLPFSYFRHVEKYSKRRLVDINRKPENVNVHLVPIIYLRPDGKNYGLGDKLFKKFDKFIQKNKIEFDLIHAHFTWPAGYAAVKLGKEYRVPSVITIHENRAWFLEEYKSGNEKIYWTWKNADTLIRVNQKDIPLLKEFNSSVFHIPNGFDPKRLPFIGSEEARSILGLPSGDKVVFSLGHLIERKGFHYLIDAMSLVVKRRKDVVCYIGGSGPLRDRLQKQINKLALQEHVKLLGFVPDEKLKYWMNAADLFVLPSLSEGNPTVMFEALGVGLPFVGTTVGGVPEVIASEDYGLLCPPADPECLAEKILIALEKEWDREKIRKYAEQFTWENITRKILKVYRDSLRGEVNEKT